jgi:hypothetical protein
MRAASSSIGRQVANEVGRQIFGTGSRRRSSSASSSSEVGDMIGSIARGVLGGLLRR